MWLTMWEAEYHTAALPTAVWLCSVDSLKKEKDKSEIKPCLGVENKQMGCGLQWENNSAKRIRYARG